MNYSDNKTTESRTAGYIRRLREMLLAPKSREMLIFRVTYAVLGIVSLVMSVVNVFTKEYVLLIATGAFSVCCVLSLWLFNGSKTGRTVSKILFGFGFFALSVFFTVTGHPHGFSIIWMTLMPTCGLMLFGLMHGTIINAALLAEFLFFFRTELGQSLLRYDYGEVFMLRFPILFLSFYCVGFVLYFISKTTQDAYHRLSEHDPLTGAFNRTGFKNVITQKYLTGEGPRRCGFIIADIDLFKSVNDTYGHFAGDELLRQTSRIISTASQRPVCRWGGEEFAVFIENGDTAPAVAELIRSSVENTIFQYDGQSIRETVSLGVYVTEISGREIPLGMWKQADEALYRAKSGGRNRVVSSYD